MNNGQSRRDMLLGGAAAAAAGVQLAQAQTAPSARQAAPAPATAPAPAPATGRPNILVIFGDDVGWANISAYNMGIMGYRTPNIDRIAREGALFTDHYAENSCTAGRSAWAQAGKESSARAKAAASVLAVRENMDPPGVRRFVSG